MQLPCDTYQSLTNVKMPETREFHIIVSKQDLAGLNIKAALAALNQEIKITEVEEDIVHANTSNIDEDFIIFASRHSSEQPRKTLSVHPIGNWGKAEERYGGTSKKICKTSSHLLKTAFQELNKLLKTAALDYEPTLEVTHHGPDCEKPSIFIEIGSTKNQWNDKQAAKVVAQTILNTIKNFNTSKNWKTAIALGGNHYCSSFNKVQANSEYAISHICPKYSLENLNKELLEQAIQQTLEPVSKILLDWKGLAKEKQKIRELLETLGLEYERV